jgi:hypothetical protein
MNGDALGSQWIPLADRDALSAWGMVRAMEEACLHTIYARREMRIPGFNPALNRV